MRVVVKFHHRTRAGLDLWRETLGRTEWECRQWYRTLIAAMKAGFRKHNGFPPAAAVRQTARGPIYHWQYTPTLLIEFVVTERPSRPRGWWDVGRVIGRLLRPAVRTVLVTRVVRPSGPPT